MFAKIEAIQSWLEHVSGTRPLLYGRHISSVR
jgi:hypothetical protein